MTKAQNGKHDETIDKLVERLDKDEYHQISTLVEYYNPGCQDVAGEIDAMAFKIDPKKTYLLLFEIKSYDSIKNLTKATKQLYRSALNYEKLADKIYMFYVTPNKNKKYELNIVWLR